MQSFVFLLVIENRKDEKRGKITDEPNRCHIELGQEASHSQAHQDKYNWKGSYINQMLLTIGIN
jgi:hypothetical protein